MIIYYYWSTTCPWCAKVEHFVKVLESMGFNVVRVCIDVDVLNDLLDLNRLFIMSVGLNEIMAPLIAIEYERRRVRKYIFVAIPSEKGEEGGKKNEDSISRDVAKLVLLTLRALTVLGVDVDPILENETVTKLLKPLF